MNLKRKLSDVRLPLLLVTLITPLTSLEMQYLRPQIRLNNLAMSFYVAGMIPTRLTATLLLWLTAKLTTPRVRLTLLLVRPPT